MAADKGKKKSDVDDERDDDEDAPPSADPKASGSAAAKTRRHESTEGVARALGVEDDEDEAEGEDGDEAEGEGEAEEASAAAPANRAARRKQQALARRNARRGIPADDDDEAATEAKAEEASEDDDAGDESAAEGNEAEEEDDAKPKQAARAKAPLPKDKNARAKELLRRRRESLEKKADIGLTAGEVVSDQLARAAAGTGRWFTRHFRKIVAGLLITAGGAAAFIIYSNRKAAESGAASDELLKSVNAESALVFEGETKDTRREDEKARDPRPVFTSQAARNETLMAGYTKIAEQQKDSGLGTLGVLGQAGGHLQQGQWDDAVAKYDAVLKSPLSKADLDVRARATEGKGFALEGKKEWDAALAQFVEFENVDKAFADLAKYHQARIHAAKGDNEKAKELLVALEKKLQIPTKEGLKQQHLRTIANEALRAIDPQSAQKKSPFGGIDGRPSDEEIRKILEQQMKAQDEHGEE